MSTSKQRYCPYCRCTKPMWKAGTRTRRGRRGGVHKQQYECKGCRRKTVSPRTTPQGGK